MTRIALAIATLMTPALAAAHPEHLGDAAPSLTHFLTDPFHVGLIGLAIAGGVAVWRLAEARGHGRPEA